MMRKKRKSNKSMALFQVFLVVVAMFAIPWIIGDSFGVVSATEDENASSGSQDQSSEDSNDQNSCTYCVGNDLYSGVRTSAGNCGLGTKLKTCQEGCSAGACNEELDIDGSKSGLGPLGIIQGATGVLTIGEKVTTPNPTSKGIEKSAKALEKVEGTFADTVPDLGGPTSSAPLTFGEKIGAALKFQSAGPTAGGVIANVLAGAAWSAAAFAIGRYVVGPLLGLDVQNSQALGWGFAAGTATTYTLISSGLIAGSTSAVLLASGIGAVVGAAVFLLVAKRSSTDNLTYSCFLWDAETGGENCELCNQQDVPCTEYQCHTLGQGCEFSIDDETGQALCEWADPNDIRPAQLSAWDGALFDENTYEYSPDNALSPPDKGVILEYNESEDSCAPAWTPVSFGIQADERVRCKYSVGTIYDEYEEMPPNYLSGSRRLYNHSLSLSLPTTESLAAENITVENGGVYDFYIKCEDAQGNTNDGNFGVKFCIQDGPDNNVPIIEETSPLSGSPFGAGQTEMPVSVYVNEPADCKWDRVDRTYSDMENEMSCRDSVTQKNSRNLYECTTTLDGLQDNQENDFYFRCRDQPHLAGTEEENLRNENSQSYEYTLVGSEELIIDSVSPDNETIFDSTSPVPVEITAETRLGFDDGRAICSLSETGEEGTFVEFFYGYDVERYSQFEHSQSLNFEEGNYDYTVRCCDRANNCAEEPVNFDVEIDEESPEVIRAFRDETELQIITNEDANCVYSTFSCAYNFDDDGTTMQTLTGSSGRSHYTGWTNNNLYIKCEDEFGNRPQSDQCSITARPFEVPELRE